MEFLTFLIRQFTKYKLLFSIFLISILLEVTYTVVAPLSLKFLIDDAFLPKDFQMFITILCILIGLGIVNICVNASGDYSIGKLSGKIIQTHRSKLFQHLQKQSLPFYQRYKVGELVPRFSTDMAAMERLISSSFPFFLKELLSVLLGLIVLFSIEWKLTMAIIAGSILLFIGPKLLQSKAEKNNVLYKETQEQFTHTIDEMVKGHKTIKSLNQHKRFQEKANKQIKGLFTAGFKMHLTNSLMERLPLTALLILNGTMLGYGGYLIFHDEMSVGDFIAFFTLFMSVGQSGSNLTYLIPDLIDSNISYRRIAEILRYKPDLAEPSNPIELPRTIETIRMEAVTFGYTADRVQLQNVNLEIAAGSYVALVGPSGSGKSTALQLLSRFYDPQKGRITFNQYDLHTVSEDSLRKLSTIVSQDTFLFNATIRENLLLDRIDATEEEMIEATKKANIHHVITSWPNGYETMIHHEGGPLSGGERQRIAIARALLKQPKFLLLDEVTSALDPATEVAINQLLVSLIPETTIISVTHRLASVVQADIIYVFKEGQIFEVGSHQELLHKNGLYKELWDKQHGFYISEDGLEASVEVERLAMLPFFAEIPPTLLTDIAALFTTETCKEGETIVTEGEEGNKFYIIVRGKVEIIKVLSGEEQRVATLQDGDYFGEIALLKNIPRTATVKALTPSVILSVRREAFHQLTKDHPQLLVDLEQTLQKRI